MSSYELLQQGPEVLIPVLLLSMAATVLAYGAFPFIFARARNSPITKKKYRGLCYGINAAVMFVFMVINGGASAGGPYLLWTWLFSRNGIKVLGSKGLLTDGWQLIDGSEQETEVNEGNAADADRIVFCRKCGEKLLDNSRFCAKCGTEIVKE